MISEKVTQIEKLPRQGYSVVETARLLGVSPDTVRRMVKRGELKAFWVGRLLRVKRSSITELVEAGLDRDGK
jgi:excisionase family DNA binding protein